MKFSVPRKELAVALVRCAAVAEAKASLPILSSVMLTPLADSLQVTATDLEVGYSTIIPGVIFADEVDRIVVESFLLDAARIRDIVKAIPVDEVDIEINGDLVAIITGGTASFTLHALPAEDFPQVTTTEGGSFLVDAKALVEGLKAVAYCQSKNADKFQLCGVRLLVEECTDDDFITTVATDGHRLCLNTRAAVEDDEYTRSGAIPPQLLAGVTIPTKGVTEICKIVSSNRICLTVSSSSIIITTGEGILTVRLIDQDYPNFNRVIPPLPSHSVRVKRQGLIDAVERCRIITNKDSKGIGLRINDSRLMLSSSLSAIGAEAYDSLTAEVTGEPEDIKLAGDYLLQSLEGISGSEVELHITNSMAPIILQSAGSDSLQAIIMPMRGE